MADKLVVTGTYKIAPVAAGSTSFSVPGALDAELDVARKHAQTVNLDADPAETVSLGDLAAVGAHWVYMRSIDPTPDKPFAAVITSAEGATQALPRARQWFILNPDSPITAITLQRDVGVTTVVEVILAQKP